MKKLLLLPLIALAIAVFFNACKKDDFEAKEFLCPIVISTIPVDKAIDVPLDQIISATFNIEMDSATIHQESFTVLQGEISKASSFPKNVLPPNGKGKKDTKAVSQESYTIQQASALITGTVDYAGLTARFSPVVNLLPDVLYLATVSTQATDLIGQALMEDYNWSFTTIAEIKLSSDPLEGGTTRGAGTFIKDSLINVVATPNDGYSFINWTQNGVPVSNNSDYYFTMDGNRDLVANFTRQHVVSLSSNPIEGGTTAGEGVYNSNTLVNVSAFAFEGYTFLNWTEGTDVVSDDENYTFLITSNRELVANFTENGPVQFSVILYSSPTEGGSVEGEGIYNLDAIVDVSAAANSGYEFLNWTEGDNVVSDNANYTFTITYDRVLVANFIETVIEQYTVELYSNPTEGGNTIGGGTFNLGASVTVSASANIGYTFLNWTEGEIVVSVNKNYMFTITSDRVLVANFTENAAAQYVVGLSSNPVAGGITFGGGAYELNESVTVLAHANAGYEFLNWTEGANVVSQNAEYTFTITGDRNLVANFTLIIVEQFNVDLSGNPSNGGTTSGEGNYDAGSLVTVSANASTDYTFLNWTEGANIVSTNAAYTFTITANRILVANFTADSPAQYTVELSSNPAAGGTTTGGGTYDSGESVTVSANASTDYTFQNWTEGANIVSTDVNYTFIITSDRILAANFEENDPIGPGPIDLGGAGFFSILTKSGISTTGITAIEGNIGVSPAAASSITGFALIMNTDGTASHTTIPTLVTGYVYASDYAPPTPAMLTAAVSDMETAYTTANGLVVPAPILEVGAGNISGLTLAPGLYKWSTGVLLNSGTTVTLSGSATDTWVFQIAQDFALMASSQVVLQGGAQASNITWVVAGQAVLGTETELFGNILSATLISLNTGATVTGRLLAQTAVTLNASTVIAP